MFELSSAVMKYETRAGAAIAGIWPCQLLPPTLLIATCCVEPPRSEKVSVTFVIVAPISDSIVASTWNGPGAAGRVRDLAQAHEVEDGQIEAREPLRTETVVDVRVVGRAVVDVAVVVVQRQPLRLDDRADLRLVESVHPAHEQRVGDHVAHRVAVSHVQVAANLPRRAHPDFAVGVHAAVATRVRVATELASVRSRADVAAVAARSCDRRWVGRRCTSRTRPRCPHPCRPSRCRCRSGRSASGRARARQPSSTTC